MKFSFRPRILDIAVFIAGLAAVIFVSLGVYSASGDILYVEITGKSGEWIEALDADRVIEVPGPIGSTFVHIENGRVAITDSPCENKLCVGMGSISEANQWVACLPNEVFVRIGSRTGEGSALDATAY